MEKTFSQEREELRNYQGKDRVLHSAEIKEKVDKIKQLAPTQQISFGFTKLDVITKGGCRLGQLIVIGGNPGQGKSSLLVTLTYNFAVQNINSLWFSFEETEEDLFDRLDETGMPLPDFCLPNQIEMQNLKWIRERIIESMEKYDTKIVIIDHLQSLLPFNCQEDRQHLDNIIRFLKHLARTLKIVVIITSHVHRDLTDGIPTGADFRGTQMIEAEADIAMFIWRRAEKMTKLQKERDGLKWIGNESNLYVSKVRRGGARESVPLLCVNGIFKESDIIYQTSSDSEIRELPPELLF